MIGRNQWHRAKITTKFNLLLTLLLTIGIIIAGCFLSTALNQQAESEMTNQTTTLMKTIDAVWQYHQDALYPRLKPAAKDADVLPEAVPSVTVQTIIRLLKENQAFRQIEYKAAATHPTNPRDRADALETELLEEFRHNINPPVRFGYRDSPKGTLFYMAQPLVLKSPTCLQCHSTPSIAPQDHLNTYGPENGFNWSLNEVVAVQMLSLPTTSFEQRTRQRWWQMMLGLGLFSIVLIGFTNILLRKIVIRRIQQVSRTAQAISLGDLQATFDDPSRDEIGTLVTAFQRMKSSLTIAMKLWN